MNRKPCSGLCMITAVSGLAVGLSVAPSADASVIYQDSFDRVGQLDGSAPDIGPAGATWTANSDVETDGDFITFDAERRLMFLPFTPQAGNVYIASVDVRLDGTSDSGDWHSLGFLGSAPSDTTFSMATGSGDERGQPWLLLRNNGAALHFAGPGTQNNTGGPGTGTFEADVFHTLSVVLDTTGAQWVASASINGTPIGDPHVYTTNPEIGAVGMSSAGGSGFAYTFDNFVLVPEPTSLALLGLGGLMLMSRRRG
ncbi:MAG: PEP-CTERM sorting domain-containing protein [Phycisphaeraceae bacterium]|nr:PEP-CTERM sorting domain-containing protein [Phycisphaeraceae bacterium]